MTAALLGPAFLKAADTLNDELNQQLIEKSAAVGGALPALDPTSIPHFKHTGPFLWDAPTTKFSIKT